MNEPISKLQAVKPTTPESVLTVLRDVLARAESGQLRSVVIVGELTTADEMLIAHANDTPDYFALVGALAHVQAKFMARKLKSQGEV